MTTKNKKRATGGRRLPPSFEPEVETILIGKAPASKDEWASFRKASPKGGGRPTPDDLVRVAKNPKDPLHHRFIWDDSVAGHKYRLDQARDLLQNVFIVYQETEISAPVKVRYFSRDPEVPGNRQGYVSVKILQQDTKAARQVLVSSVNQAASILRNARGVATAVGLLSEVDVLIDEMADLVKSAIESKGA